MPSVMNLIGNSSVTPTPATAEDAAAEYFTNRTIMGDFTPRPQVHRWRPDERERFERELARLEAQRESDRVQAVSDAVRRGADVGFG